MKENVVFPMFFVIEEVERVPILDELMTWISSKTQLIVFSVSHAKHESLTKLAILVGISLKNTSVNKSRNFRSMYDSHFFCL